MAARDTTQKANDVYFQRLKEMTPSERLSLGVALWETADSLQRAAALHRNPYADQAELTFHIAVSRFGPELARKAYLKHQ